MFRCGFMFLEVSDFVAKFACFQWSHIIFEHPSCQANRTPTRYNELTINMFTADANGFPRLKGKAAEVKHLAAPLLAAIDVFLCRNEMHQKIRLLLELALTMEDVLESNKDKYALPSSEAEAFRRAAYGFAQVTTSLGQHFHENGDLLFHYTIKYHYLCHLGDMASYINPRLAWCYGGEDFMQISRTLVQSAAAGTSRHLVAHKVVVKYASGFGMDLVSEPWKR